MTTDATLLDDAASLLAACREQGLKLATAESCTGGLIFAILTEAPGASDVMERAFVTYSNAAKTSMLGVPDDILARHGAVSEETARAMAIGALQHAPVQLAVSVTGIAGPGGGSEQKPVGLVHLAAARSDGAIAHQELRLGDLGRQRIRLASVGEALKLVRRLI